MLFHGRAVAFLLGGVLVAKRQASAGVARPCTHVRVGGQLVCLPGCFFSDPRSCVPSKTLLEGVPPVEPPPSSTTTCTKFVECEDGLVAGTDTTCHEACKTAGGNCCVDQYDCNGFTGKVCADNNQTSCNTGDAVDPGCVSEDCIYAGACENATMPIVVNSCNGPFSCKLAGDSDSGGTVGSMTSSCNGYAACDYMAIDGGTVGPIIGGCNGLFACYSMTEAGGDVGSVIDSCNGDLACFIVAIAGGTVGSITDSCNGYFACYEMADNDTFGSLAYSCNEYKACYYSGDFRPLDIDFINGSCNTEEGCEYYSGNGLTCIATTSPNITFSTDTTKCFDTDSDEVSTCDGSSAVCTSLCPDGDAYIPSNYWVPPLDKPGISCESVRLKIPGQGEFSCIPVGEGICRDNGGAFGEWRFGIEKVETPPCEVTSKCRIGTDADTFPVLIDPANTRYPITGTTFTNSETGKVCKNGNDEAIRGCNYAGTTHICISENIESDPNRYSNERPYMFFYDEKTHQYLYQLVCDGIGEEGKLPELKMVNNEALADATYVNYPVDIVKFKKGATPNKDDANELWRMYVDWNGFEDPETRRVGQLASFIGVAHPKLCTEYVSATDKPCWKEDCAGVETADDYERDDCQLY